MGWGGGGGGGIRVSSDLTDSHKCISSSTKINYINTNDMIDTSNNAL